MANTPEYTRMREAHCRAMAENAKDPGIKRIHKDLADRYAQLANEAEQNAPRRMNPSAGFILFAPRSAIIR
jgi:hypothetical protein